MDQVNMDDFPLITAVSPDVHEALDDNNMAMHISSTSTHTQTHTQTHRHTHTKTHTQRHTHTKTHTHTHAHTLSSHLTMNFVTVTNWIEVSINAL